MKQSNLIIRDELVEPPTDSLALRTVTMVVHENLDMNVLLHSSQEMKDLYYHWMKVRGLMDYFDYILADKEVESGIWLSSTGLIFDEDGFALKNTPKTTIVIKYIRFDNQISLLGRIKALVGNS
jgi:hypothetical protein